MPKPQPAKKSPVASAKAASKGAVFARRAASTVTLWVLIGFAVATESVLLLSALIVIVLVLACAEFLGLLGLGGTRGWRAVSAIALVCALGHVSALAFVDHLPPAVTILFGWLTLPLLVIAVTTALLFHAIDPPKTSKMFMGSIFGVVYTAMLGAFMIRVLHEGGLDAVGESRSAAGIYYLLFLLAATKFTDMGAYIVGTAIGKHKFIPHISPGKTWEGILLGGFPFAILGGCAIYWFFGDRMPALGWTSVVVLSIVFAAVAVVGDLAESIIKRCLEKKDSGAVLPGIGGVLDLVDSVLFTAPVMYFYLLIAS